MSNPAGAPTRESTLSLPSNREIRIERIFDAPRERVWRAFTDTDLLRQWWGRGNKLDVVRNDVQPGGEWRFVEHHEGGSDGFEGRYREIVPLERISQTFEWDGMKGYVCLNVAEFADAAGGRTKVTTTVLFFTPEERDGMIQSGMKTGLDQSYAALDTVLTSMS